MTSQDEVVTVELPAPEGWVKKYTPSKSGTPRKNEIVFISPTGEEIKSKRQLEQYLKSYPEGPLLSEFDWGTGDTPRRSARLSEKTKATDAPTTHSPKKKQRKSSAKKGAEDNHKIDADAKGESKDEHGSAGEDTKGSAEDASFDEKDAESKEVLVVEKDDVEGGGKITDGVVALKDDLSVDALKDDSKRNGGDKVDESNEAITEADVAKIDEPESSCDPDKENPGDIGDKRETGWKDQETSKEEQAGGNEPSSALTN